MNEDDFLTQFRETPRPEFADQLYRRINQPMTTINTNKSPARRRLALTFALLSLLLVMLVLASPTARTLAADLVRQLGAITVAPADVESPAEPVPTAAPPTNDAVTFARNVAEASAMAGFTVLQPGWLPAGYEASGDWSVASQGQGVIVVREYRAQQGEHFLIFNQYRYGSEDQFDQSYGSNETVTDVQVRGQQGLAISGRLMAHPDKVDVDPLPTDWLMWEEDGVNFTLFGNELGHEALMRMAESLGG